MHFVLMFHHDMGLEVELLFRSEGTIWTRELSLLSTLESSVLREPLLVLVGSPAVFADVTWSLQGLEE